jgi:signal transduction histidine kinase
VRSSLSIQGYRAGFLFVVMLLAGVTCFTLWAEIRTNEKVDALVSQALTRDMLIGRIRVDALSLESAVEAHILAADDDARAAADERMAHILEDISVASQEYTRDLPSGELETWILFNNTCQALAAQVRKAVTYSKRKQGERARQHLVERIRPVTESLDHLAEQLSRKNGEVTTKLLRQREDLRLKATIVGAVVAAVAVALSLLVGAKVTSLLKRQERTIQDQLAELAQRNQELDAFASRVAHDLVSPLSPLKGYLQLIRRSNTISDAQVLEMLALAESSAGRMAEMVEALLRFCRAGTPSEPTVSDLSTAVSTLLTEVAQTAAQHGVTLDRFLDATAPVACPAQLLQSIAQNVLSNAVKYTTGRPDPRITVRVAREQGEAVFEVTDNGLGMSEATQRGLFKPFFRAPEARAVPGHGLGLATTRRLVEAHGGSIAVRSQPEVGTQVTVRFPLAPVELLREPSAASTGSPEPLVAPATAEGR